MSTDTTDAMAAIEAMAAKLRDEYGAEAVILYGSRADGRARPDSDVDLLIIKSEMSGGAFARSREVDSVLSDLREGYWLDTRVVTPDHIESMLAQGNHFVQDVILRGRVLYEDGCFGKYVEMAKESYRMDPQESDFPEYWIKIAERDNRLVLLLLREDESETAGFHLQQMVEKFFKAYLIRQGWRLVRTHNLGRLLDDAVGYDGTLEKFRAVCELVTKYYFAERYPWDEEWGEQPDMSDENVRAALAEIAPLIERLRAGSANPNDDDENEQDIQGVL